jgi:hypothetical protein
MKTKINFTAFGVQFKNIEAYNAPEANRTTHLTGRGQSAMVKQYVKALYGCSCQVSTDFYSMGSSVDVWLDPRDIYADHVKAAKLDFRGSFQSGSFNGMEDIYEYDNNSIEKNLGIDFQFKFATLKIGAKYGTKKYEELEELGLSN